MSLSRFLALHAELCDDWRVPSPDWFAKLGMYAGLRSELTRGGIDVEMELRHRFPQSTVTQISALGTETPHPSD